MFMAVPFDSAILYILVLYIENVTTEIPENSLNLLVDVEVAPFFILTLFSHAFSTHDFGS